MFFASTRGLIPWLLSATWVIYIQIPALLLSLHTWVCSGSCDAKKDGRLIVNVWSNLLWSVIFMQAYFEMRR